MVKNRKLLAEQLVEESVVLLKNENQLLPLQEGQTVAVFGRSALVTYVSGNGSGAARGAESSNIIIELEKAGISVCEELKQYYLQQREAEAANPQEEFDFSQMKEAVNSGLMYEIFGTYHAPVPEYPIPECLLTNVRDKTNTAILVLGRNAGGEECDRRLEGDYYLTEEEKKLVSQVCENFPEVIVILNVNGLIDLEWTTKYASVKSILFLGLPGEGGAKAVAEIIKGNVSPSGKLAFTIAHRYEDYPSAKHFSWDKEKEEHILTYEDYGLDAEENGSFGFRKSPVTVYQEDIYNGYRYFSSFGKEVLFPFGHGLSYTKFALDAAAVSKEEDGITIIIDVKNVGLCAGREVVQIYVSMPDGKTEKAERELKGFAKTEVLKPGEKTSVSIHIPWDGLSCYEEKSSVWLIEKGRYKLRMGTSSEETVCICELDVSEDIIYSICRSALGLKACNDGKLTFLKKNCLKDQELPSDACGGVCEENPMYKLTLSGIDVKPEKREAGQGRQVRDFSDFTEEQLAALLVGYGSGIPFAGFLDTTFPETICDKEGKPLTCNDHPAGHNGYVSPAIKDKGIHSVFYMDGPAGIGRTAWPTEMLLACAFNKEAWYRFGEAVGAECEEAQVDVWLAPAVNLHRNPLCGRNFEYFSEDPFLTGVCACAITKGVQENHQVLVCPKHFAVNEQETYRRGNAKKQYDAVDSVITERAARELYLKPFEMLVKKANVRCIMTSFNKINGIFAGGNSDLCNRILREEWGYEGFLVTDWGDMDIVVDGADAVAAGNDVVMPGGPPVIKQILNGYREGRVTRRQLETAASHLLRVIKSLKGRNGKNGKEDI